jgi:hypothetical protein
VKVHYTEGVVNHSGPKSCAVAREGDGEALTGVRIGQPSSRENGFLFRTPTRSLTWKATRRDAPAQASSRSGVVLDPGMCARSSYGNREILGLSGDAPPDRIGKARSRSR